MFVNTRQRWHHYLCRVFTNIYSLPIDKDGRAYRNILIQFPCVFMWSLQFLARVFAFLFLILWFYSKVICIVNLINFSSSQSLAHVEAYIDFSEDENIEDNVLEVVENNLKNLRSQIQVREQFTYQLQLKQ